MRPDFMHSPYGVFIIAPQEVDGDEVLVSKQKRFSNDPYSRELDAINAAKPHLSAFPTRRRSPRWRHITLTLKHPSQQNQYLAVLHHF